MHRYALEYLEEKWFVDPSRKPLILRGARQTGKTWLAREFAKRKEFAFIELNFERNPELKSLFESNDPKVVLRNIEIYKGIRINLETSLLFLDEIQDAPEVLSKLRWFYEEVPELPVIAAGSLLDFILSDHSFSMPVGRISYLYIEPLSFEEFLLALDEHQLLNYIKTIEPAFRIPDAIHQKLSALFNLYCFVGGMPACVVKWIETKTFLDIAPIQEDLVATYRDDFYKYKGRLDVSRLLSVLSSIPNQLGQKFMYSRTGSDMQANVAKQILTLFNKAKITHTVKLSSANTAPLSSEIKDKAFKQIFLDVGLVNRMLSKPFQHSIQNTTKDGGISEQVVGQMLRTLFPVYKEPELYYWQREEQGASSEIDYLIEHNGEVVPVEVKSGSKGSLKSLHYFMYKKQMKFAVRINDDLPSITEIGVKLPTQESVSYTLLSIPFYLTSQVNRLLLLYKIELIKNLASKNREREAFDILLGILPFFEESLTVNPKVIFDDLSLIIQTVALHKDLLTQACGILWKISKYYDCSGPNDNHPITKLKEIFSYKSGKLPDHLTVAVDWAINLLQADHAVEYPFSPFVLLGEVMRREGSTMDASDHSKTIAGLAIDYEFVAPLRRKVIEAFRNALVSPDIKKSCEAAKFLPNCLTSSNHDNCPWTKEAINTLEKLNYVVKNEKIKDFALITLNIVIDRQLSRESSAITNLLINIQSQIHKTIQNDKELCMYAVMMGKWNWLQSMDITHVKNIYEDSIFDKKALNLDASYNLVNSKYQEILIIDKGIEGKFKHFFSALCETNLDFSEYCVQQALNPQANDRLWQFAWIPLSMLLHYNRSKGQEYAAKLLKSSDKNQRELVGQAYRNLSMNEYQLDDVDNESIIQIITDSDESVISSGLMFIQNIAFRDGNYPKALDWMRRIRKDVSDKVIQEMFEIIRLIPLKYYAEKEVQSSIERLSANKDGCNLIKSLGGDPTVSTLKTKEQVQEQFSKENFAQLCEYLIALSAIPSSYNDGIEAFLLKIIDLYPEIVLDLILKRAEHAIKNKLLERSILDYQILSEQFLTRNTSGVFPSAHNGIRSSIGFVEKLRKIPKVESVVNQWLEQHKDDSQSYELVRSFLRTWVLSVSTRDPKADKLMAVKTDHIFEEARNYINKTLPNMGDNGWLTHNEAEKAIKDFYDLVRDAFTFAEQLEKNERQFAKSKWNESREHQKFEEEIKPLFDLFNGYPKAFQQTFDHLIHGVDRQANLIPCTRIDASKKQRYALQLFPSQETPVDIKVPSLIKSCGYSEQYDGCIEFTDGSQQKIEVTVANKGEEEGKLKSNMRQNRYAIHPMNDHVKVAVKCLYAIQKKLNEDKHKDKYTECWLVVVINGWQFESIEDLESFLHFFQNVMQKEQYSIDWAKIKSIIIYTES